MRINEDARWLDAAAALAERARPLSRPNPAVGAIIVKHGIVVGRGWTQHGGRPHAEAVALAEAGEAARGATLYVTLEPCAHRSERGPACARIVAQAGLARVVILVEDPDPRTAGNGALLLREAGIAVEFAAEISGDPAGDAASRANLAGYLSRKTRGRPYVTLKLAMSLDGCIALRDGKPLPITGAIARSHLHRERARHDAILVGGGTLRADDPRLDVRLPGLEKRSPRRIALTRGTAPEGWEALADPALIDTLGEVQYLFVEGGAAAAAAFLNAGLVDELMIYRAPILLGSDGLPGIGPLASGEETSRRRWQSVDRRPLGRDALEIYRWGMKGGLPCLPAS